MSPELRQYLTEWYEWATGDAVDGKPFWRDEGLCLGAPDEVTAELNAILIEDLGGGLFPFGGEDYLAREISNTMHLCPKRLAWVASKIGQPATEQADNRADQAIEEQGDRT